MTNTDKHVDILILDDDIDLLTTTAELLADIGYKVKGFADPESALEFAIGQTFSVGLFDFRLGSLKNGLDVVETMQALGCKSVYVMVSADVESQPASAPSTSSSLISSASQWPLKSCLKPLAGPWPIRKKWLPDYRPVVGCGLLPSKNLAWRNGAGSTQGLSPMTICAMSLPAPGPKPKPWPENPDAR